MNVGILDARHSSKKTVSVFIPVFRESKLLKPLLEKLIKDPYPCKEIICIIDEPTQKSLETVETFKSKVKFIVNGHRKGKVNALNEAYRFSTGEVLLFLDGDCKLPDGSQSFLEKVVDEIEKVEILDIKKKALRNSLMAKLTYYDYFCHSIGNYIFSKTIGRCIAFNGAAFAIKRYAFDILGGFRRVLSEDSDLAIRSFLKGFKFKLSKDIEVYTQVPPSLKEWYTQRRRWGIGAALWIREYYKTLAEIVVKHPKTLFSSMFAVAPSLTFLLLNILPPTFSYENFIVLLLSIAATKLSFLIPSAYVALITLLLLKNILPLAISFAIVIPLYWWASKKLNYTFNPIEFSLYYFLLSPLWLLIVIISLIRTFLIKDNNDILKTDWKI
ncbi:hypothetical protein DRO53_04575 [Candidatus Bathyarchaeota archaeon]|nr:MAG: hypothetical protein DRO53_04575 [Candidatus Bathyarchaeota archaeon]